MGRLLHISASPREERSHSLRAAETFLRAHARSHPDWEVDTLDVWDEALEPFDGALLSAKYAKLAKRAFTEEEARAWSTVEAMVARLDSAETVLISTPMWNMSIPYRLKHYIDLVTQPGLTFLFDPATGYTPLLRKRPTVAIVATSGDFSTGTSWGRPDLASPYLRQALKFIGLSEAKVVLVGPTAGAPAGIAAGADAADQVLVELAQSAEESLS